MLACYHVKTRTANVAHAFEVIPAVDVLEGRAVRLREGVRERIAIEGGDPAALAERFAGEGARRLHLVDLDGAFAGDPHPVCSRESPPSPSTSRSRSAAAIGRSRRSMRLSPPEPTG